MSKKQKNKSWIPHEERVVHTACLYPKWTPREAHTGKKGRRGCRCARCVQWYLQHKAERQARREWHPSRHTDTVKPVDDRNRVYQSDWLAWQAETAAETQRRQRQRIGQTEKIADLAKRADDYAWRVRAAARERCRLLGITVTLTLAESQHELEIYRQCFLRSDSTGTPHHVDHIVPLSKEGEHHPNNLQILTATENLKKGNRLP